MRFADRAAVVCLRRVEELPAVPFSPPGGRRREVAPSAAIRKLLLLPAAEAWGECALSRICGIMAKTKLLPEGLYAGRKLTEEGF